MLTTTLTVTEREDLLKLIAQLKDVENSVCPSTARPATVCHIGITRAVALLFLGPTAQGPRPRYSRRFDLAPHQAKTPGAGGGF